MTTAINRTDGALVVTAYDDRPLPDEHKMDKHFNIVPGYTHDVRIDSGERVCIKIPIMLDVGGNPVNVDGVLVCTYPDQDEGCEPILEGEVVHVLHSSVTEISTPAGLKILVRPIHVPPPDYVMKWRKNNPAEAGLTIFVPLQP